MSRFRNHLAWSLLALVAIPALWYAWALPGAAVMFACIALAFVLWNRLGSRGSWVALIVLGVGMGGLLGWEAVTASRCPDGDSPVFLKENKPPVACEEMRASAAVMGGFFGLVALIGIAAPIYARSLEDVPDPDEPLAG